jgi:hypothetical protein
MSTTKHDIHLPPIAEDVEFDPSNCEAITSENVQGAIEDLCAEVTGAASPGYSFGRTSANSGTWLRRVGQIPTNRTGVTVGIQNPIVTKVFVSNQNIETYTIGIYEHDGNSINLTQLGTVSVSGARGDSFNVNFPTSTNKQLAVRVETVVGSVQNIGVDIILTGSN